MKKLVFVINDRAEIGKSTLCAALRGNLRDEEGFDAHLVKMVVVDDPESAKPEFYDSVLDVSNKRKVTAKKILALAEQHDVTICDVETEGSGALIEVFKRNDLEMELSDLDIELTVVIPEVEEGECHEEMCAITEAFSDHADYIVARTPLDEFTSHLEPWEESDACEELAYLGAIVIDVPRLTDVIQDSLEEEGVSAPEGVMVGAELADDLTEMLDEWRETFRFELEAAADYLHPARSRRGLPMAQTA